MRDTGGKYNRRVLETVAHYRILERLGDSRLGETFRARDTRLGRSVALLTLRDDIQNNPSTRQQLLDDAHAAMAVSHPSIAALYEAGEDAGRTYLAFEFVPGEPLERVIAGHPLNPRRAVDLAIQVADGLAEAHAAQMSHGGVTARTVIVTPKGNAKLVDFGFASWTGADAVRRDEASDLESLRALLFEMLTGRHQSATAVAPTTVNKSLPAEIDDVLSKTHDSAVVFAAELRAVAAVLETRAEAATRAARPSTVRGRPRRSKAPWIATVLAIVAAAMAAAWWWFR